MDFEELRKLTDDAEMTAATYEIFDEDSRLNRSQAARVEFLTNTRYIERQLKPGARILDIGAGAGEYSLHFAELGYDVSAVELAPRNVEAFRKKIRPGMRIDLRHGNALDLSGFADEQFDAVLLFGPLYHLRREEDRQRCIREAMRVCRPEGTLFFAYIANDMVILTEFRYRQQFFSEHSYDHDSFKVEDFPFVFFTVEDCREMLRRAGVTITAEVASDGVSEMLEERINALDEYGYRQYLRYHFYTCEKPEMLGHSNHLLFIGKK